jgi:hypothetical protein
MNKLRTLDSEEEKGKSKVEKVAKYISTLVGERGNTVVVTASSGEELNREIGKEESGE